MESEQGEADGGEAESRSPRTSVASRVSATLSNPATLNLTGVDGATSLKEELVGRVPQVNDAATFRQVRNLVREEFHGAMSVLEELILSTYVDPTALKLTTGDQPFNVFARFGAGVMEQPGMKPEQEVLGDLSDRFMICRNKEQYDLYWDSQDPKKIQKASMSYRHRFLTTKDLNWEWFNALVFGLLPVQDGGVGLKAAISEIEAMKAACLRYANAMSGWSGKVGLFVNVFGHNNMNSLFIHILDMSCLGPSFEFQHYKNLPLDSVLKVLREEAISELPPRASLRERGLRRLRACSSHVKKSGQAPQTGTGGATSLKSETVARFPNMRDAGGYRHIRRVVRAELGGAQAIFEELSRAGFVHSETQMLTTGVQPFNVFARIASGKLVQPGMDTEQSALGEYQSRFCICSNRPECDEHWDSEDSEWVGRSSMSLRHRFLTTRNLHWQWFNALVFGLVPEEDEGCSLAEVIREVEDMKAAALQYARSVGGWSKDIGLFAHIYGHNSINSLHVHIVDLKYTGPSFRAHVHKNCPLDDVLKVLREEYLASSTAMSIQESPEGEEDAEGLDVESDEYKLESLSHPSTGRAISRGDGGMLHTFSGSFPSSSTMAGPFSPKLAPFGDTQLDIIDLNVGGRHLSVARSTLLQAPEGSVMHSLFSGNSAVFPDMDNTGRMFLDLPPDPFCRIVDYLRLRQLLRADNSSDRDLPPNDAPPEAWEFWMLARALGVECLFSRHGAP